MSDLLRLLDLGAGAIQAQNTGIAVAGNNTANVNTEGYSRQSADLVANQRAPLVGGVSSGDPFRAENDLLSGRQRLNAGASGMSQAFADALMAIEQTLTSIGIDITDAAAAMFARLGDVSTSPMDLPAREAAIAATERLAVAIRRNAEEIERSRRDADDRIRDKLEEANALAREVAEANRAIAQSSDPVLKDQRDLAALKLADLVGGRARIDSDGMMRVVLAGGGVLVDGKKAAELQAVPDPALADMSRIELVWGNSRRDVTGDIDSGAVAGELRFRDVEGAQAAARLDQFAFDMASQFNAVHSANAGLDGTTGRNFFVQPGAVAGAALGFDIDPAIAGDASRIAAATPGSGTSNNEGALALLGLRDAPLAGGGQRSFIDESIKLSADLGRAASSASIQRDLQESQRQALLDLRDSLSGVSVEEELVRLSQFQHAAEASAKFIGTVDQLLGSLIQQV